MMYAFDSMTKKKPPVDPEETYLLNFKVKGKHLILLKRQAKNLTDGNMSKLLRLSALNRKTPFESRP